MSESSSILAGLKVVDCGTFIFGPAAATVLSDFGADVIKVEPPGIGDPYRYLQKMAPLSDSPHAYGWLLTNRNKRGIVLDLKHEDGRAVLRRLVAGADVFVTNYQPSVLRDCGATYGELSPLNPRLVYAHATGYGAQGDEVEKPGYDATAWWARSGLMDSVREGDSVPALSMAGMGDHPSAMTLVAGILLALFQREQSGRGTRVSSSLLANGAWSSAYLLQAALVGADPFRPICRSDTPNALVNRYRTRDDRWVLLAMVQEAKDWARLPAALSRPDLADDARFATVSSRRENACALVAELDATFSTQDLGHWREVLDRHDITFGFVQRADEVAGDRQMLDNGILPEMVLADGTRLRTVDSPLYVDGAAKVAPRPAPRMGEHGTEILRELGYSDAEILRMRDAGVTGPET